MNNGVNNNNQTNNTTEGTLAPMAGVTIAPAQEGPVNASTGNNTAVVNAAPQAQAAQPVIVSAEPQPQTQTQPVPVMTIPKQETPELPGVKPTPVVTETPQPQPVLTKVEETPQPEVVETKPKQKINITAILVFILILLIGYIVYTSMSNQKLIASLRYNCTPINSSEKEKELDLNSTLVKDLYSKVETNIREDIANPNFDDAMKLYLAYRQVKDKDKYDTKCDSFSATSMEPYTCEVSTKFVPKAFKEETLIQEVKKLYGENTNIPLKNIQLGQSCIVGYQYIPERKEFVEGYCGKNIAISFKATKKLTKAVSTGNTIILTEQVKYHANEKMELPASLQSGTYIYVFRLDINYNYVLVSKTYESKY